MLSQTLRCKSDLTTYDVVLFIDKVIEFQETSIDAGYNRFIENKIFIVSFVTKCDKSGTWCYHDCIRNNFEDSL